MTESAFPTLSRLWKPALPALAAAGLVAGWIVFGGDVSTVATLDALRVPVTGPLLMVGVVALGGLAMLPMLALVTAAAMLYEPVTAFAVALAGVVIAASLLFWTARAHGRPFAERRAGAALRRIDGVVDRHGAAAIALLRATPVAPFVATSLAAGVSGIRFADYLGGTVAGLAPVIVAYGLIGRRLARIFVDPTASDMAILAAVAVTAAGLGWAAGLLIRRLRPDGKDERGEA